MTDVASFASASAARGMLFTGGGFLLSLVGGLFTAAYTFREIGAHRYGVYIVVISILGLVAILQNGLFQAAVRAASGETAEHRRDLETAILLNSTIAVLFLIIAGVLAVMLPAIVTMHADESLEFRAAVLLLGTSSALTCWTASYSALAFSRHRFDLLLVGQACALVARVTILVLFLPAWGLAALGVATLAGSCLDRLVLGVWLRRSLPWFTLRPRFATSSLPRFRETTGPLLVLSVTGSIMALSDALVLNALAATAAVGFYRIGAVVPQQVSGLLQALFGVLFPKLVKEDDPEQRERLCAQASRPLCLAAGLFLGTALVLAPDIVNLLFDTTNATSVAIFRLFAVALMLDFALHPLVNIVIARGRLTPMAKYAPVELIINLTLTIGLVLLWGPAGAALAALITIVLSDFVVFPFLADRLDVPGLRFIAATALLPMLLGAVVAVVCIAAAAPVGNPTGRLAIGTLAAGVVAFVIAAAVPTLRRDVAVLLGRNKC